MEVKEVLKRQNFKFDKRLGQNFVTDPALLAAIVDDSGVTAEDVVVEVGTGAGTLTRAIAAKAKRVLSFELDERLKPILAETLSGLDNVEVVFRDVLKMRDEDLLALTGGAFKVVANLPYYVTTPMIIRFVCGALPCRSVTVMVQKEVAVRIAGNCSGDTDYGSISAELALYGEASVTREVSRTMFYPAPQVDSAVLKIEKRDFYNPQQIKDASALIKLAFLMRRKTLYNNLKGKYDKAVIYAAFADLGLDENVRGERLSAADFVRLAEKLK